MHPPCAYLLIRDALVASVWIRDDEGTANHVSEAVMSFREDERNLVTDLSLGAAFMSDSLERGVHRRIAGTRHLQGDLTGSRRAPSDSLLESPGDVHFRKQARTRETT